MISDDEDRLLARFQMNNGASRDAILATELMLNVALPIDYKQFLLKSNGGEGFIGNKYLMLWRAEELESLNEGYEIAIYAPGLLIFGSNGGGEGYAFRYETDTVEYCTSSLRWDGSRIHRASWNYVFRFHGRTSA
jgi:hypothetical protein